MALKIHHCLLLVAISGGLAQAAKVSSAPKLVGLLDELNNPEDTNATITCSLGSGELEGLTYEWFKDNEHLYASSNKIRIEIPSENYQSTLRVYNLKPSDSALYTCLAKNRFGQDKISTKLNVKVQLKWTREPKSLQVPVGTMVHVPCQAEGNPAPTIEWHKILENSKAEPIGPTLRFSAIEQGDSGNYQCRASNGADEDISARIRLDVLVNITVSKAPKIVDPIEKLNHAEETNATFTCSIGSGDLKGLTYEWRKDEKIIDPLINPRKLKISVLPENFQSILRVIDLKEDDAGVYSCIASNAYGQDKVSTKLGIKVQLKWISELKNVETPVGRQFLVPCSASGSPKPTIEWTKVGGDTSEFRGSELYFAAIRPNDAGEYECRAKNGADEDLVSRIELKVLVNVTVSNEPRIVVPFDKLNHQEGTNATFTCSIGSGDLAGLTFEWRKDDAIIIPSANSKKLSITTMAENFQSTLRVTDLKPSDAGLYSCLAKNKYGQDKVFTRLSVKVHLKWVREPDDVEVGAGKALYVPCRATGSPDPTVEWTKVGESKENIGQELRFVSVGPNDSGYFECRAKNGVDKDLVARIKLSVLGK